MECYTFHSTELKNMRPKKTGGWHRPVGRVDINYRGKPVSMQWCRAAFRTCLRSLRSRVGVQSGWVRRDGTQLAPGCKQGPARRNRPISLQPV